MKRPLALIGLTSMTVLAVCSYTQTEVSRILFLTAAVGLIVSFAVPFIRRHKAFAAFFAAVLVSVTLFSSFVNFYILPIQQRYVSEKSTVSGTLCEEVIYERGMYFYEIKANEIDGEKADVRIMLSIPEYIECKVGDTVEFTSEISAADFGGYLADRIYLSSYIYYTEPPKVTKAEVKPLYYYAVELRDKLRSNLYLELSYDNASLATAILLGDNSGFEEDVYSNLRTAGLTHVVVVSGLHLSILTMLFKKSFGRIIKNRYVNVAVTVLVVLFFLSLTGFGKSSIRAAIMLFVVIGAGVFGRESDSVNSLGLAAILLCVSNPCVVGDVGVLLSFSATFGIVAYSQKLENLLTKKLKPVEESWYKRTNKACRALAAQFACSFTAALATLPVTVIFFGRVSLVQVLANLCILPVVQYFMLAAFLTAVFRFIPYIGIVTDVVAFIADIIGGYILKVAEFFASIPFASVRADYTFVIVWIAASVLLLIAAHVLRRKIGHINLICLLLCVTVFALGSITHVLVYKDMVTLHLVTGEKGYGVLLSGNEGNVSLVSSGDSYVSDKLNDLLSVTYSECQLMVVTSHNNSASESAERVMREFDYEEILMYDTDDNSEHARSLSTTTGELKLMYGDTLVDLWNKAELYIIERKGTVYMHLSYGDSSVLLLPYKGDAAEIPEDFRSCDVIVASEAIENMHLLSCYDFYYCNNSDESEENAEKLSVNGADVHVVSATDKFNVAG